MAAMEMHDQDAGWNTCCTVKSPEEHRRSRAGYEILAHLLAAVSFHAPDTSVDCEHAADCLDSLRTRVDRSLPTYIHAGQYAPRQHVPVTPMLHIRQAAR